MPESLDVAVVGAGVLGLAHAYHLARQGRKVTVFERHPRAQGASVRNFGMIWPVGQAAGTMHTMALRSREIWRELLSAAGIWFEDTGSLHLAYREDEAQVLLEFAHTAVANGYDCELLTPEETQKRSGAINPEGLITSLYSPTESCVDPRQVIGRLPEYLTSAWGVRFEFGCGVTEWNAPTLVAGGREWRVEALFVCTGDEFQTLFPEVYRTAGLFACKLQMMRSKSYTDWKLGPMLAAGLTLQHYKNFSLCPSLPALKARFAVELPDYLRYGIHVMASQNGDGEIVIGDSHEYGDHIEPFDKAEIDDLILRYLGTFLLAPDLAIASHWQGIYAKHPTDPFIVKHPTPNATVVTGAGGAGMTLSFGLAEQVVQGKL